MNSSTKDKKGKDSKDGKDGDKMKRFMFDTNDFDKREDPADLPPVYSEEQLVLAKTQNFNQGKAEGIAETKRAQEEMIIHLLQSVGKQADVLIRGEDTRDVHMMMETTRLALRIAEKVMPRFVASMALKEIEGVILQAIEARKDEPRIAITVATVHLEPLRTRIDALSLEKGYAGKMILIADDNMGPSDCRVEWADGGAERLYDRLMQDIENEFEKALSAMQTTININKNNE